MPERLITQVRLPLGHGCLRDDPLHVWVMRCGALAGVRDQFAGDHLEAERLIGALKD